MDGERTCQIPSVGFNLLDPDHTTESFWNHVTGRDYYYSDGCAFDVLVALLEAGVVTRELVASIAKEKSVE